MLFNPWYTVMIFTYSSALNKETNVENPIRNHVRDESSGSDFYRSLNSHWCLWSEQLPLRAPRGVWDWGSQQWPATVTHSTRHLLQSHHTSVHCVCSTKFNNTSWNAKILSGFPCSHITTKRGWEWREGLVQLRTEVCDMLDCWVTLPVGEVHCLPPDRLA